MALTLWCGDCGAFLRNVRELEANRCFPCSKIIHDREVAAAAREAVAAYHAAEVHAVCLHCSAELTNHRGKVDGTCGTCLLAFQAMIKTARITYIDDVEARTVGCPTCSAPRGGWCYDGIGAKRKLADTPHLGRKVLVMMARQQRATSARTAS